MASTISFSHILTIVFLSFQLNSEKKDILTAFIKHL
jgi:hypothetical protein